jgi:alkyl hydroperoxide reductase subunit F
MNTVGKIFETIDVRDVNVQEPVEAPIDAAGPEPAPGARKTIEAPSSGSFDTVIIGGGPAGMTAGVYMARKLTRTLLISPELGGQVLWTSDVENYPGYSVISGWELASSFRRQLEMQLIHLRLNDSVTSLELTVDGGRVVTDRGGRYDFQSLIIASGKRSRKLGVPGEDEFLGRGVTYCATCDGPLYRGETVAVVGGGNSALSAANEMLALGCTVHLINFMPGLQADGVLVERAVSSPRTIVYTNHQVDEIIGNHTVTGIRIHDRESGSSCLVKVSGVFVEIGLIPNAQFAEGILALNEQGEILVNCFCETNIPGIFAAGDVTSVPDKQIVIAAGEGAKAALGVTEYLLRKERRPGSGQGETE